MKCPNCEAEVEAGWKFCPNCQAELPRPEQSPAARIHLDDAVAKEVRQTVSEPGGAAIEAKDAVLGQVDQHVEGPARIRRPGGADETAAVRSLASINAPDAVIKTLNQNVTVNLVGADSLDAILGLGAAGHLTTRRIFVACGRKILAYDPTSRYEKTEPASVYTLPDAMGSARSVRLARQGSRLLVLAGARCGVVAFDAQTTQARVYPLPRRTEYGANAAAIHGEFLYATHSRLGLLRWPVEGGEATVLFPERFGPAATVRGVAASLAGQLVLCAESRVYRIDLNEPDAAPVCYEAPGASSLVGAVECGACLFAAATDGGVYRWRVDSPGRPDRCLATRGEKAYSVSLAQMPDGPHVALGARRSALRTIRLIPPEATVDYQTPGSALIRWARAASDLAVATDGDGRRLFVWRRGNVYEPELEIPVADAARRPIMDLCLLSQ